MVAKTKRIPNWLPNTFIIGAPKSGTTSLHAWISDHPQALGSLKKETYFMVDPGSHMYRPNAHISKGLESWSDQFLVSPGLKPKVILESTPANLYYQTALTHITSLPTGPKCICILREPAAQIYSLYSYFRDNWNWIPSEMTFEDYLSSVRSGSHNFGGNELAKNSLSYAVYVDFLSRWQAKLAPGHLFVATFDELQNDKAGLTMRIARWLGLDDSFYTTYDFPVENETYAPRNRVIQSVNIAVREFLPKGRTYNVLRKLYRRVNTSKPQQKSANDAALLRQLSLEFASANERLSDAFDLDLSSWNAK